MNIDLEDIKNVTNTLFWGVTGTVTVLAYLRAKKTILQPIKTEVFKEQIKEFSKELEIFNGKSEPELRDEFGFENMFIYNTLIMMDSYALLFFDLKIDKKERPYGESEMAIVKKEDVDKYFSINDGHIEEEIIDKEDNKPDPSTKHAVWSKYDHALLSLPKEYSEMKKKFLKLQSNPLLPEKLITLLVEYEKVVMENMDILREIIIECSQEMPQKYSNVNTLMKATNSWVYSRYNSRFINLSPKAEEITKYIRSYFQSDNLFD
ncbi:hypothetical protein MRBLBA21_003752 [Peribacillus frigoritolerans]|uniref:hypothetical protein n=1 Tax=Peribacillus frigoritolerans TaxID=450367 RepID=UPI0034385067